jgi:glycosyltransferase involved in cell wall biosynthesis
MNVLYIWDADYPWDVRVEKICKTLADNGYNVHIAARNLKRLQEYELSYGLHIHRLKPLKNERLNYALSFPAFFSLIWASFLGRVIRENSIGLIIVRDLPMAIAGIWAGKRYGIPVMFDMAEDYVAMITDIWKAHKFQGLNLIVRNPYLAKLVEKYTFKKMDYILAVVDEAKDLVIRRGGRPDRVTIVGNTPSLESFNTDACNDNPILERIRNSYSVIYTGGVQMGRGIQIMIDAIPNIIKTIPDFLFVVVGDGYATHQLKELMLKKSVQGYILWTGWVDHKNIFDYLKACKAGVIPHFTSDHVNTTIPNKIFDYMGHGLPVVTSDAIPLKRIVEEEKCGLAFKSGDADDLARVVVQMHSSKEAFGENGKSSVFAKYNWAEDTKRLLVAVDKCVKGIRTG